MSGKKNDNKCKRRICYDSEDDSLLAVNFESTLKFSSQSEEPMDVDDCTYISSYVSRSNVTVLRKQSIENCLKSRQYNNQLSPRSEKSLYLARKEPSNSYPKGILAALAILFGIILCYNFMNHYFKINDADVLQNIAEELRARVLFQDQGVQIVAKNFQCMNTSDECRRILPFVGSTGVGKSFISNIIKKHFPYKYVNEVNLFKLNNVQERDNIVEVTNGVCNLIIMDDLKFEHINSVLNFVNTLPNVRCLYVIPIFNIQETTDSIAHTIRYDDFKDIAHKFGESNFKYEAILFNVVNKEVVEKWLEELLKSRNFDEKHFSVIRDVLEHQDIKHYGFKGIEAKVNLLLYHYSQMPQKL